MTRFPDLDPVTGLAMATGVGAAQTFLMGGIFRSVAGKLPMTANLLKSLAALLQELASKSPRPM